MTEWGITNVYENAAHHPVSALQSAAKDCISTGDGWLNCQYNTCTTLAGCAEQCAGYAFFQRADGSAGDNNCLCCASTDGTPGTLSDEGTANTMNVYTNAAHPSHITCTACPNGKTVVAQAFTVAAAGANGANRFCTLKSGFSGSATYAAREASASWTPAFGTPEATADGFTVQISNHDVQGTSIAALSGDNPADWATGEALQTSKHAQGSATVTPSVLVGSSASSAKTARTSLAARGLAR
jgi:hypothetical protein